MDAFYHDVLMLEDDLNEETMDSLSSMKETVYRCKGLVQTFLGFSKKEISEAIQTVRKYNNKRFFYSF
mgnify:CR=1 FL=1